jgi:hypothetical protein
MKKCLQLTPAAIQWWVVVKIEDYGWKESNDHAEACNAVF